MTQPASERALPRIVVAEDAAQRAAAILAKAVAEGVQERDLGILAVSGGRTPIDAFHALSETDIDWERVFITLVDERWVDPESEDSNQRLVETHLMRGPAGRAYLMPMKSPEASAVDAAGPHNEELAALPRMNAVLLGMGEDGHFASLFPGSPVLAEGLNTGSIVLCLAVPAGEDGRPPSQPRLSLTLTAIARADTIVLLTSGEAKLAVLKRALSKDCDPMRTPIAALFAARPDTLILHGPS
jgi:6-phosphogluconolactonase